MNSDHLELLRRLAISDERTICRMLGGRDVPGLLDDAMSAVVRFAALLALDAADVSLQSAVDGSKSSWLSCCTASGAVSESRRRCFGIGEVLRRPAYAGARTALSVSCLWTISTPWFSYEAHRGRDRSDPASASWYSPRRDTSPSPTRTVRHRVLRTITPTVRICAVDARGWTCQRGRSRPDSSAEPAVPFGRSSITSMYGEPGSPHHPVESRAWPAKAIAPHQRIA